MSPMYKVLGGEWGEGHQKGDVVEMDSESVTVRLEKGELEEVKKAPKKKAKKK